jgi:hypothetical protein
MAKKYKRYVSQSLREQTDANKGTGTVANPAATAARRASVAEFNPDYSYIIRDLKRIGILAGSFLVILVALSFILN